VARQREWDYWPQPDGEPFTDKHGNEVLGWHDRAVQGDPDALLAEFQTFFDRAEGRGCPSLIMRPILARGATEIECRINGWEEGTFVRCTPRAKKSWPMWQIEIEAPTPQEDEG